MLDQCLHVWIYFNLITSLKAYKYSHILWYRRLGFQDINFRGIKLSPHHSDYINPTFAEILARKKYLSSIIPYVESYNFVIPREK
jgi:hypothetical protein